MIKKKQKEESQWIREIAYIMKVHKGPFTKTMLAAELEHLHPKASRQEIMIEISSAFSDDKYYNKPPRFRSAKKGWWDLAER
jgi:hypothetical protein